MNNPIIKQTEEPVPAIGVSGIAFNRRREVLLIKRGQPPAEGLWSIPGGRLEPGESLAEACAREFFEETALRVAVKQVVAVVERKLEGFHYVIIDFLVALEDENNAEPKAQSDVAAARWIAIDQLDRYPVVEGLTEIIRRAIYPSGATGLHPSSADLKGDYILPAPPES